MEIRRDEYLDILKNNMHTNLIKVITGVRRCGKSYLLNNIFYRYLLESGIDDKHIIRFALDSREDLAKLGSKPYVTVKGMKKVNADKFLKYFDKQINDDKEYFILLDEVQELQDFEFVLNGFLYHSNYDTYVTGSNSRFLSTDIITEFRGRSFEIRVFPLSFSEYHTASGGSKDEDWTAYIRFGGMPMLFNFSTETQKINYLRSLFDELYYRDIIERNNLHGNAEIEELTNIIASSVGSLTNPSKLERTFKSSRNITMSASTIKSYIKHLEEAFLINEAKRYDIKGKKYINTPLKYYFVDPGLRNAVIGFRQIEETHLLENVIYNELLRSGYDIDVGEVENITKNEKNSSIRSYLEVDFVCNRIDKKYYVQSALSLEGEGKVKQEKQSLKKIDDSFRKIIISKSLPWSFTDEDGIAMINLFDFLQDRNIIIRF